MTWESAGKTVQKDMHSQMDEERVERRVDLGRGLL